MFSNPHKTNKNVNIFLFLIICFSLFFIVDARTCHTPNFLIVFNTLTYKVVIFIVDGICGKCSGSKTLNKDCSNTIAGSCGGSHIL